MNTIKNLRRLTLISGTIILFSFTVTAQRGGGDRGGGRGENRGGGRSESRGGGRSYDRGGGYSNNSRGYQGGNVYRGYQGGNVYRGGGYSRPSYNYRPGYGYRPSYGYGYGRSYNYYPSYRYHPIYRSYGFAHFGPAFGFRLSILPFGYYPFYVGDNPYYYYNGIYYRPYSDGGYEVVAPPLGATVTHLPSGAKSTVINGQKYYELGGTYYQEELTADNRLQYVVVGTDGVINTLEPDNNQAAPQDQQYNQNDYAPPAGVTPGQDAPQQQAETLTQLPANSKAVNINQQKFYLAPSGIYYKEIIDANNNISYQAVGGNNTGNTAL